MITSLIFYIVAALIIFTALQMVLATNLVHSSLFMAATFFLIAVVYILLNADYLAIVQVMVYVGAISILFVFGVMLTKRDNMEESNPFNKYKKVAIAVACALFLVLVRTVFVTDFTAVQAAGPESTILAISALLLNEYSIAFEATGILLLVATVGAIVIGKGVKNSK
jgi:NADH-quinone oxidoreductase subunit J